MRLIRLCCCLAVLCTPCPGSPVGVVLMQRFRVRREGRFVDLPHFQLRRGQNLTDALQAYNHIHNLAGMPYLDRLQYMLSSVQSHPKPGRGRLLFALQVDLGNRTEALPFHEFDNAIQVSREFVEQHGMVPAEPNRKILLHALHSKLQRQFRQQSFSNELDQRSSTEDKMYFEKVFPGLSSLTRGSAPPSRLHQLQVEHCIKHKPVFQGYEFMETVPRQSKERTLANFVKQFELEACVETGTFEGVTTLFLSQVCTKVVSIELSEAYHKQAKKSLVTRLHPKGNIRLYQGDSGQILDTMSTPSSKDFFEFVSTQTPTLFYLDGHYSSGSTALGNENSPLFRELSAIFRRKNERDVIIVDDVRCFHGSRHRESLLYDGLADSRSETSGATLPYRFQTCMHPLEGDAALKRAEENGRRLLDLSDILDFICSERPGWVVDLVDDMLQIHAPSLAAPYA